MVKLKASSLLEVLIAMSIVIISMVLSIRIMVNVSSSTLGWREVNDGLKSRRVVNEFLIGEGCFYELPYNAELNNELLGEKSRLLSVSSRDSVIVYQKVNFDEE
jgi:hypothetical protein